MELYIARHGETIENAEKRILGGTPGILSARGREQARMLAENIQNLSLDLVRASDLQRVKDTYEELRQDLPVEFTPQLRERTFGAWEGRLRKEVDWQGLWESPDEPRLSAEIGAEPLTDFTHRIAQFAIDLHSALGNTGKSVLLLTHIGVMNRFNFLSSPDAFVYTDYPNAEATHFDLDIIAQYSREILASA